MSKVQHGSLMKMKADVAKARKEPYRPVLMVMNIGTGIFQGVYITGHNPGQSTGVLQFEDYELLPKEATVEIEQPRDEFRPGDLVADDHGVHIIVTSVKQTKANYLFSGVVFDNFGIFYRGQYGDHWDVRKFRIVRRREDIQFSRSVV